jgi:hypothetical protein
MQEDYRRRQQKQAQRRSPQGVAPTAAGGKP